MMIRSLRLLRRNLGYKLIALVMAVLLYAVAYTQQNPRTTRNILVTPEVQGLPPNLALQEPPRAYMLTVTGPTATLETLDIRDVKATVDLSGAQAGTSRFPVNYELPEGIPPVVEISGPRLLPLTLERKIRKSITVEVAYADQPPAGFAFTSPVARPSQVEVVGLEPDVRRVVRVVASIDTSGAAGAIEEWVDLVAQDTNRQVVSNVDIQPPRVRVSLGVKQVPSTKTLVLSPVFTGEVARGYRLVDYRFTPQTVTVSGPPERLELLSSLDVPVSREGLMRDTTRTVTLQLPPGLQIVGPRQVTLTLQVRPDPDRAAGDAADTAAPSTP